MKLSTLERKALIIVDEVRLCEVDTLCTKLWLSDSPDSDNTPLSGKAAELATNSFIEKSVNKGLLVWTEDRRIKLSKIAKKKLKELV